jgi:hypothetical protein
MSLVAGFVRAEGPATLPAHQANWPRKVTVTVGEIRTRIDGPKLWTLSGIDFQKTLMATEDSAYGTVLTIRGVGHLGTAHFLDVPGKPGAVEKENVTSLKLFVDDEPIQSFQPTMELNGKSFRMERTSKIRAMDLVSTARIGDGVLTESVRFHAHEPIDLQGSYPFMYAWKQQTTHYVFGDEEGIRQRGAFRKEGKTEWHVIKDATWMAEFDAAIGKGCVCRYRQHPSSEKAWFLLVDAPGIYHKVTAYTLIDRVVPKGFEATYESAVGFFTAMEKDWEEVAVARAGELKAPAAAK